MVSSRSSMTIGGSRTITVSLNNSMAIVFAAEIKGEKRGKLLKILFNDLLCNYTLCNYFFVKTLCELKM